MDLIEHSNVWAKGEVLQGRIMLFYGILLLVSFVFIWKSNHEVLRGTMIPLGIVICVMFAYGAYLMASRSSFSLKLEQSFKENQVQAANNELARLQQENKTYSTLKPIWVALILASAIMYFLVSGHYWKGLSIGLIVLFLSGLLTDTSLHYRLSKYMESVQHITA